MSDNAGEKVEQSRSVAFEYDLPDAPEKVWRALTTPEIVSEWLMPVRDFRPEEGSSFTLIEPAAGSIDCQVISVEQERAIRFSWRDAEARREGLDSTVSFEIAGTEGGGTHLRIVHEVRHAARMPVTTASANDNQMRMQLAA
jgi:uncharacterized protein YndB with AHSA1/START domain